MIMIGPHPGYIGDFADQDAPDAPLRRRQRVRRTQALIHDGPHQPGDMAVVLGSVGPLEFRGRPHYGYWVEWDDAPGQAVFVIDDKLEAVLQ